MITMRIMVIMVIMVGIDNARNVCTAIGTE